MTTPRYDLTVETAKAWVEAQVKYQAQCAEHLFGMTGFANSMIIKVNKRGLRAYGGIHGNRPYVKISEKTIGYRFQRNITAFKEYGSIMSHSVIGSFDNGNVAGAVMCAILHEIAHAIDYWTLYIATDQADSVDDVVKGIYFAQDNRTSDNGGHGNRWKAIYHVLREKQLNGGYVTAPYYVEEAQTAAKRAYKSTVKHIKRVSSFGGENRRYFIEGDDNRFTMIAKRNDGSKVWMTYLHDANNNQATFMMKLNDGRKLRQVAKVIIESANEKIAQKAA